MYLFRMTRLPKGSGKIVTRDEDGYEKGTMILICCWVAGLAR